MTEPVTPPEQLQRRPGSLVGAAVLGIAALGIALRLAQYLHNRALWLDEAALALQLIYKSPAELLGPLSWHQNSPIGFLLALKAVAETLGTSELALRFLPLAGGLLAVPAFGVFLWQSSRDSRGVRWDIVLTGLMLFAVGKHLIYYSSELRHYSWDVLAVCVLLVVSRWAHQGDRLRPGRLLAMALTGLTVTWLLLAPIFVLAAITASFALTDLSRRRYLPAAITAGIGLVWLGSFLIHLNIVSSNIEARGLQTEIETMNAMSWAPLPTSLEAVEWYRASFDFMFYHPVGLTYRGLGGFAFLLGLVALWRRDKSLFWLVAMTILFTLAASYLQRYPFRDRYIHFLAPLLILGIAEGVGFFTDPRRSGLRIAGVLLAVMLLAQPTYHALKIFKHDRGGYEIRPLIRYMTDNWSENDGIYVPLTAVPPFLYYWPRLGVDSVEIPDELLYNQTETTFDGLAAAQLCLEPDFAWGRDPAADPALEQWREEHLPALMRRSDSVWIPFEHDTEPPIDTPTGGVDEIGRLLEVLYAEGATVYRYASP